ncbi:hypothetical protein BGZ67_004308 [Mortierella alpina]|nr:hypothetical protein BGZ67_004308 [Mortierella alpina]
MAATRVLNNILICLLFRFFSEYAGEQTGHDPIESASLCSADDGTKSASVVDTPARCLADDEDQKSNPLDIPQTHQTPSLPTGTYAVDGSYPTYQADSISNPYPGQVDCRRAGCAFPINVDPVTGIRHGYCSIQCARLCGENPRVPSPKMADISYEKPAPKAAKQIKSSNASTAYSTPPESDVASLSSNDALD